MKASTLKLSLPVIALTAQQSAVSLAIPPFLQDLGFPVVAIGSLISLGPFLALAARIPTGLAYRAARARLLIVMALLVIGLCNFLYTFTTNSIIFALIHSVNGFALGAATTLYLAFFVEALPQNENRHHAMGIYMGCLAISHSSGSFLAGVIADRLGYPATFQTAAFLALLCAAVLVIFRRRPDSLDHQENRPDPSAFTSLRNSLRAVAEPEMASVVVVALFLNLLHQIGNVFLPLYGLAVGLTLTQIGIIKGLYALCNAITRPLSGFVVTRMNSRRLCNIGLVIQAVFLMLVPLYSDFGPLLTVFLLSALMRAVVVVSNAISMVQDVDQTRLPRGLTSGVYNAAGDLGNILGPSAGGLIGAMTGIAGIFVVGPLSAVLLFLVVLQGIRLLPRSPVPDVKTNLKPPAN